VYSGTSPRIIRVPGTTERSFFSVPVSMRCMPSNAFVSCVLVEVEFWGKVA
jgi:hypothetical protein